MTEETNEELERFRRQWREEVSARAKPGSSTQQIGPRPDPHQRSSTNLDQSIRIPPAPSIVYNSKSDAEVEESDGYEPAAYHDLEDKDERRRLGEYGTGVHPSNDQIEEPQSALEHYEKAVERENQGSLGDSLSHYRKAYRVGISYYRILPETYKIQLDAKVDQTYRNKHFPPSSFAAKSIITNPSNAAVTVPNPAHHSLHGHPAANASQLIASFASDVLTGAGPPTEGSPSPPCPIASIPFEVLIEILLRTAIIDVAAYVRLSLVCKRLAYLVSTEDRIWQRVCSGPEFGFAAMHYAFACHLDGTSLPPSSPSSVDPSALLSRLSLLPQCPSVISYLPLRPPHSTYAHLFQHHPRLRFNGCYISTVNYVRPGASGPNQISWNTPVHIVTYYRYLRFLRNGSCISLLTTAEPADVVPYLLPEYLRTTHSGNLPSSVMRYALRGRWRLSGSPFDTPSDERYAMDSDTLPLSPASKLHATSEENAKKEPSGNLYVETEGPDAKYTYSMQLALRSASHRVGATRNNKLAWRGFWSYNRLTDDWAEFGLRNDRPFFWSRVRSWGLGA
ncbi:hypothetical protein MMC34_005763 [Xylographa carneopallida]|nr:hypothetical protein [Xylographa carneopallida]